MTLRINSVVSCRDFPCLDVDHKKFMVPQLEVFPESIKMIMVSEATPQNSSDYYYAGEGSLFVKTTLQAFEDAGIKAKSIGELVERGVYFTTAIKCTKKDYLVKASTIKNCSHLFEKEIELFPNVKVIMLMGDFAIKAMNEVAKRQLGQRVTSSGSTYKIRGSEYYYKNIRLFPSYLQAGPAFFIEQSKRRMIKEDLEKALKIIGLKN